MRRLRRILRAVLVASVALAMWTLARPVLAAPAPLCDDRAATALAGPPALEAPDVAVRRARTTAVRGPGQLLLGASVAPDHRVPPAPPQAGEPAGPQRSVAIPAPAFEERDLPPADVPRGEGVLERVERPPRD
jgi:hypothetical protein